MRRRNSDTTGASFELVGYSRTRTKEDLMTRRRIYRFGFEYATDRTVTIHFYKWSWTW
jgi:hypothetical protein